MAMLGSLFSALFAGFLGLVAIAPKYPAVRAEVDQTAMYRLAQPPLAAAACLQDEAIFVDSDLMLQTRPTKGDGSIAVIMSDRRDGEIVAVVMLNSDDGATSLTTSRAMAPLAGQRQRTVASIVQRCDARQRATMSEAHSDSASQAVP